MDDLDRTYLKLKRKPLVESIKQLQEEGKFLITVDPMTFAPIAKIKIEDLEKTGWSVRDLTDLVESKMGYKMITIQDGLIGMTW
jgi:hypothetical protein